MESLSATPSGRHRALRSRQGWAAGRRQPHGVGLGKVSDHKIQVCNVLPSLGKH